MDTDEHGALAGKILAIKIKSGTGWDAFKPDRILKLIPGDDDAAKARAASELVLACPSLVAHWPFLEAVATLQAAMSKQAVLAVLAAIDPKKMVAGKDPELAPLWHGCLHVLVVRAFAGCADELADAAASPTIQPGLIVSRCFAGGAITAEERAIAKKRIGVSGVPGVGKKPSEVLVWTAADGLHPLAWKPARAAFGLEA